MSQGTSVDNKPSSKYSEEDVSIPLLRLNKKGNVDPLKESHSCSDSLENQSDETESSVTGLRKDKLNLPHSSVDRSARLTLSNFISAHPSCKYKHNLYYVPYKPFVILQSLTILK